MNASSRGTELGGDTSAERYAYQWILQEIRSGRLAGGTRLKSEMLATAIGVSRIPVREAIRRLESEGFITVRRNRGAIVTPHGPEEIREIFEIRAVLEGLAARLGTHQFDRDLLLELKNLLGRLKRARHDYDLWINRHTEFHLFLCSRCGRARLISEIAKFNTQCEPYMRLWYSQRDPPRKETDEHQEIIGTGNGKFPPCRDDCA